MKKCLALFLMILFCFFTGLQSFAMDSTQATNTPTLNLGGAPEVSAKSAVLYEANTGTLLYEKNGSEALSPASVTKIMTLLLVAEAIDEGRISLDDSVIVSKNASSMGGSQVFLKEGEEMLVEELLKCTIIASANDASVALAEHVAGSEENFVRLMNEKAEKLSLNGTHFENTTGLDDTVQNHTMSALDIAKLSSLLLQYDFITKYSSLWQDTIRNGEFTLTNTNRLVRYYEGCNGLKTGSTDKAGYCVSVSAKRNNVTLVCVIMGADTKEIRNDEARSLLDFGFASVSLYESPEMRLEQIPVAKSSKACIFTKERGFKYLCKKGEMKSIEKVYEIPEFLTSPIMVGDAVGKVKYYLNGDCIGECDIVADEEAKALGYIEMIELVIHSLFSIKKD